MKRKLDEVEDEESTDKKVKADNNAKGDEEEVVLKEFDVKKFRHKLKTGNFFDDLKLFIRITSKTQEVVYDFINAGGKPLEIVEIIKSHEDGCLEVISNLYNMLNLIVQNIINDENQRLESTAQALKYLVNKNSASIVKMLSTGKSSDKIIMLKILTVAVQIDREIGHDILRNISTFSKTTENKGDLSIFEEDAKAKKKVPSSDSVRRAFVNFIMSFLLRETDVVMCKKILQKRGLFEFFLQGLYRDNYETIKDVLSCLTKNVLISPGFSKPEKLKFFTDDAIKHLLKLYEWKGAIDEKENVVNLAHHFLILLLTNRKHGIAFKGLTENRQNSRQLQVLGLFKNVWMYEYPSLLAIEIIKACPDLMQILLNRLAIGLLPKPTLHWFMCANFTKKLISEIDPTAIAKLIGTLDAKKISNNIIRFSVSQFILQQLNENALIQQENLEIREISTSLLHVMLMQCCKFLEELTKMDGLKDFEKHRIKFDLINHLFTFFPHIDIILNSLYRSILFSKRNPTEENKKLVKSQLKNTLEILLLLIESFPATIEKIPSVVDYLETLRQIYEYQLKSFSDENNQNESLDIEMKIIKIILSLQPNILSTETPFFDRIFGIMIQIHCSTNQEECHSKSEAKTLLIRIIKNIPIFSTTGDLEISIWLEAFKSVEAGILKESINAFIRVLKSGNKSLNALKFKWNNEHVSKYNKSLFDEINNSETKISDENKINLQLSYALPLLLKTKSDKLNRIVEFVEILILLLYHSFPELKKSFILLLKQEDLELNTNILSYMKKKTLSSFNDALFGCKDLLYSNFQNSIIEQTEFFYKVEDVDKCQILILQAIFCTTRLAQNDLLTDENVERLIKLIKTFFMKLLQTDKKDKKIFPANERIEKAANKIYGYDNVQYSANLAGYIFEHNTALLNSFNMNEMNQMTKFVEKLIDVFKSTENFCANLKSFSSKIITQLSEVDNLNESVLTFIEKFPFNCHQYHELITIILEKEASESLMQGLKICINKISDLKSNPLSTQQIVKIENIYVHLLHSTPYDLNEFEQSFRNYFTIYPHCMADISCKIFEIAFQDSAPSKSYLQLIMLLFNHKNEWNEDFIKNGLQIKKEFLFPLLKIAFAKDIIRDEMLKPIYAEFKSGIVRAIEKPNKAAQIYRENIESSLKLISRAMPQNECRDLATKKFKFESTAAFQIKMLHAVYQKAFENNEDKADQFFYNFIYHWIQLFGLAESKDYDEFTLMMTKWLEYEPKDKENNGDIKLHPESWNKFYTACLKNGLKTFENSEMLVILGKVTAVVSMDPKEIATIFDLIFTHSNFFNLAFNAKSSMRKWKRNLYFLLNVLVQKNPDVAHEKHIPIYLSSYQATMSSCDQLILNLLRFYEIRCGIDLHDYSPLLFGQAALSHFTSHEHDELKFVKNTSLDKMDAVFFKLLNLFEKSTIENTLNNYPIERQLAGINLNQLSELLKIDGNDNVYDPGYFLPLFEMILTTSSFNFLSIAVKNELIALIPPALSCEDENMRLLAAHVLLKCRENTEGKKKSKEIWLRFYDLMQRGLADVKEGTKSGNKDEKHFPRAPSISTRLLAEFCRIIPNKLHPNHGVISNYLIIREKFEFSTVPELLVLFHSSEMQHEENRLFLLNTINNGIRDNLDFKVLNNTPFLKIIFSCYACPLSNRKIDLLILKIIDKLILRTDKTQFLIEKYGLGLWIFQISVAVEAYEYDILEMIVSLINDTFKVTKTNESMRKILQESLLTLSKKFTKSKLSIQSFLKFLTIINEINKLSSLNGDDFTALLEIAAIFVPLEYMQRLMYLWNYSKACSYIESVDSVFNTIAADESTKNVIIQVRELIIKYHKSRNVL